MVIIFLCLPPPDFLSTHHRHILTTDNNHKHYNYTMGYTMGLYNFIRGLGGGGGGGRGVITRGRLITRLKEAFKNKLNSYQNTFWIW